MKHYTSKRPSSDQSNLRSVDALEPSILARANPVAEPGVTPGISAALQRAIPREAQTPTALYDAYDRDSASNGRFLAQAVTQRVRAAGWLDQSRSVLQASLMPGVLQRDTTVNEGVDLDILDNLTSMSTSFALGVIRRELGSEQAVRAAISRVLSYAFNSLTSLSVWIGYAKQAYDLLSAISSIPRGVVAAFLWGMGKLFLLFANKFYNGGRLAATFGEVTESGIYTVLHGVDASHVGIQQFIGYIDGFVARITYWVGSLSEDDEDADVEPASVEAPPPDSSKFIKLTVATPTLSKFTDEQDRPRAGLQALASAHVKLFGQKMGGDLDVKLPFGSDWQIGIENFFESSPITLPQLSIGSVKGDALVFSNEGLMRAAMSVENVNIAGGVVKAKSISVLYRKQDKSLTFEGQGSAQLWGEHRLNGSLRLVMGTDGSFKEGMIDVASPSTFQVIPDHLDIVKPGGRVEVFADKAPNLQIQSGIAVKGLPGGVSAEASGGVRYLNSELSGFLNNLDINIPMGQSARLVIAIIDGDFNSKGITAKSASMDFDYDKSLSDEEVTSPGEHFSGANLSWLNVVGLEQLSLHKGLSDLSYKAGKFSYTEDEGSGLRKVRARVLGVTASYDAEKNLGSVAGDVKKELSAKLVQVEFPVLPGVGGYLDLKGILRLEAGLEAALARSVERSDDTTTVLLISGEVTGKAAAALELAVGAFAGVPYLASIKGGLFGRVEGAVSGRGAASGGIKVDKTSGKVAGDDENPPVADFELMGELTAQVGAELKASVLVFEKSLARAELGDWTLGRYRLRGEITSLADGKPQVVITEQGFEGGKPTPVKLDEKVLAVNEWIDTHVQEGTKVEYGSSAVVSISRVARNILFGSFSDEEKALLATKFQRILKNDKEKRIFLETYSYLAEQRKAKASSSFIWTAKMWDAAVKRTTILGFDRSASKAYISKRIALYHSLAIDKFDERLAALGDIERKFPHYYSVSKDPENVKEAKQLQNQINLEKELIAKQRLDAMGSV